MTDDDTGYVEDLLRTAGDHLRRARALTAEAVTMLERGEP